MVRRIGIDIDGVLRNWEDAVIRMIQTHYPETFVGSVRTVANNMHEITTIAGPDLRYLFSVTHVDEVYANSNPFAMAWVDFGMLQTYAKIVGDELVCVSNQWDDTISATMMWLAKYGFIFKELHFTKNKYDVDVDFLIDDSPRNYAEWVLHGRTEQMFILFNQMYNKLCRSTHRINSLPEAIRIIKNWNASHLLPTKVGSVKAVANNRWETKNRRLHS